VCDRTGRFALHSANQHNFGLTSRLNNAYFIAGEDFPEGRVTRLNGLPNVLPFQVKPKALPNTVPLCRTTNQCCDQWRAQTGHDVLPAAMADGSVRMFAPSLGRDTWGRLMLPRDGFVVHKDLLPSQEVTADATLVEVADLSKVWVVADLFEADASGVSAGTKARITSPSVPGFEAITDVSMVSSVVDPSRHTVSVRVELPNDDQRLRANIFAEMRFRVPATDGSVEIEASALVSDGAKQYVYVEAPKGKFSRREVVAGSARGGIVPVFKGIAPGEIVVVEGAILLDNQIDMSR
jgi:hypothetical protein